MNPQMTDPRAQREAGRTGGNTGHPKHTTSAPMFNPVEDAGVVFAGEAIEAERTYLTAAWLDPVGGNDAACNTTLTSATFSGPEHSLIFWYVCKCAELGRAPTVVEAVQLAAWCNDVFLREADLFDILIPPLSVIEAKRIDNYAATVADFARRRDLSRAYARRSVALFVGDDYEVVIRPRYTCAHRRRGERTSNKSKARRRVATYV